MIIDATCATGDIHYPTDLSLLNEAWEKTEKIIDQLYRQQSEIIKKQGTHRLEVRNQYLMVA